jgi:outer membrane protein TolC
MMLFLLIALQAAAPAGRADSVPAADSVPRITLGEAIRRSTQLDPDYVRALGQMDDAEWGRRAAVLAFVLPSVQVGLDETKYSQAFFNPANPANPTSTLVVGRASARYELSFRKFSELSRTKAEVASADAGEVEQRYRTALETESSYYDVLVNQELTRVGRERVSRAREGLTVARARVSSGAAVPTDSLQLVLELIRSQVEILRQENSLRRAQLELGRRVGAAGPVDGMPADTLPPPELPLTLPEALRTALDQGPQYRTARANESAAEADLKSQRGDYLPTLSVGGLHQRYDTQLFPGAANISSLTFSVSLPIWDDGLREIEITRARVNRDVTRAVRSDLERVVRRDVTDAFDVYQTSRAAVDLAQVGVTVARETYRMQQLRYRSGASTILDLLDAQVNLAQAEAGLVQARYANRLALAGLEAILGRRLFTNKDVP